MGPQLTPVPGKRRAMVGGLNPFKRNVLVEEILIQCALAEQHYGAVSALLADFDTRQSRYVWAHIHAFLTHMAMVSKMVSSPNAHRSPTARARGEALVSALNIDSSSVIFDRNARNNVEHLDERLDLWIESDSHTLLEVVLDNRSAFDFMTESRPMPGSTAFVRRVLIQDAMIFITQGRSGFEEIDLKAAASEISDLKSRANAFLTGDTSVERVRPGRIPF
ncbi:hypothetical protein [Methylobacterium sp. Leaf456]|uniref:hypothetical protein n=1 Tax=Methylobacterium sp. Leaf456 TaxID=1736382 RepID=UPI000B2B7D76|nr:hypothetical protein [Methylobacterium sp. Leaf456]